MKNIEKVKKELEKIDELTLIHDFKQLIIQPEINKLYINGIISTTHFSCMAKEYCVFNNADISIIL
ncbi:MAG: hypothetical protein GXO79_16315 [Chlorobi bacterium]|nr:hypothetical protein [Chlorobiota bacterium]